MVCGCCCCSWHVPASVAAAAACPQLAEPPGNCQCSAAPSPAPCVRSVRLCTHQVLPPPSLLPQPFIYNSWDEPYAAGKEFYPIFWDAECPEHVPAALAHLAGAGGGKVQPSGASSEL